MESGDWMGLAICWKRHVMHTHLWSDPVEVFNDGLYASMGLFIHDEDEGISKMRGLCSILSGLRIFVHEQFAQEIS